MEKHLHIVCFDVPYPINYGGAIDLFCKIVALHGLGVKIHLHCFDYGRGRQKELNPYCAEVHYYKRSTGHRGVSFKQPYIVSSRNNEQLFQRLLHDDHPILLEGVHCSAPALDGRFRSRKIFVRLHNVEHLYYRKLAQHSSHPLKKIYYRLESRLLEKYERELASSARLLPLSERDADYLRTVFNARHCDALPVFLPFEKVNSQKGNGLYCLFHGNLAVEENHKAALFLLKEVFHDLDIPLVIAGRSPSRKLVKVAHQKKHTCIVADPGTEELQDMIQKAQINILPSYVDTGIKLKLLNALFNGRHCIVNDATARGTGLESACHFASDSRSFQRTIRELFRKPFEQEDVLLRKNLLEERFDNEKNAEKLIRYLW